MSRYIRSEREKMERDGENREEDKKFLYHKITLSSSDVIFYVPIYASGRERGGDGRCTLLSCFVKGVETVLRYKMKEARVERGCSRAEIEKISYLPPPSSPPTSSYL